MYRHRSFLLVYASKLGHTRHIALWLARRFEREGIRTRVLDVGEASSVDPGHYTAVIAVGSVHFDRPSRAMVRWLRAHRTALASVPLEIVTVSLTAAAEGEAARRTVEGYARRLAAAAGAEPMLCEHVAGALQYTRYDRLTRRMVRRIAEDRGLPTDGSADVELTDWDQLERFVARSVELADRTPEAAAS